MRRAAVAAAALAAACTAPPDDYCPIGTTASAVRAADRKILGAGAGYRADATLRGRDDELRRSMTARRAVAWQVVERVLAPIPLAESLPGAPGATVPAWQTWYGADDLDRLFKHLYDGLGADGRAARTRFGDAALDDALAWNTVAVESLDNWPEERWLAYLDALDSGEEVAGVGGIAPVSFAPATARHLLASYPEILACRAGGAPAAFADAPATGPRRMVREPVDLARCATRGYGPYFVASGETLRATTDAGGAELTVGDGDAIACTASAGEPCEARGPGTFYVEVAAGPGGARGALDIDYDEASPAWAACLDGQFPIDAVAVKASWHRADFGRTLPTYDTSAAALRARLDGDADWGEGDGEADPGAGDIYTARLDTGNTYRLAGLHIATKELDHWLWITLWWSDDPDTDFGADRPASLTGPWRHYKMCVASAFDEGDPAAGDGAPSWCSNPYIELGHGNAGTNCIGCHQHAGAGFVTEDILADGDAFPAHGRTELRNNFPHDYSYAVDAGDHLGASFADVVDYYDGFE